MTMKRFSIFTFLLVLAGLFTLSLAQSTTGGTVITNTATASFTDSSNTDRTATSNQVETRVRTVYSFNIEPDDGRAPQAAPDDDNTYETYAESDNQNDVSVEAGEQVTFTYTVENSTNNAINTTLTVDQYGSDDFNLAGVTISVVPQGGGAAVTPSGGQYTLAQETTYDVTVTGTVPSTQSGGESALVDLRAVNNTANGDTTDGTTDAIPNVTIENNNIARVSVLGAAIGVAKEASIASEAGAGFPGEFVTTIDIRVENLGDVLLDNVNVVDDLAATFPNPASYTITANPTVSYYETATPTTLITDGSQTSSLTLNTGFTGNGANTSLTVPATSSLAVGEGAILTFTVRFNPNGASGFTNQATATADSPEDNTVTDLSDNGTDTDADNDGNPNEATADGDDSDENDPTPIRFGALTLDKSAKVCSTANCTGTTDGSNGVVDASGATVEPGQFIVYTIAANNAGNQALTNIVITDLIPANTVYVSSGTGSNTTANIQCSRDSGSTYSTGACTATSTDPVTHVRSPNTATLAAGGTSTFTFVVQVP